MDFVLEDSRMNRKRNNEVHEIKNVNVNDFKLSSKQGEYIASAVQADTMFTFATKVEFICNYIKKKYIPARYCIEDISYLKIKYDRIAIPMKCFCDIRLHDMEKHLDCYGHNGIAFSKEWGLSKKLQPILYINTSSYIQEDYAAAFGEIIEMQKENKPSIVNSYVLGLLLYMKPTQWNFKYRTTGKTEPKCFTEECEWRFIPNFNGENYKQILFNERDFNEKYLNELNSCLAEEESYALTYDYDDVKYIIVEDVDAFKTVIACIEGIGLEHEDERHLISKIIIWSESKGDF